jgi:hypothetical protein
MREFHAPRDQRRVQSNARMMLSPLNGDGEIGIAMVCADDEPWHRVFRAVQVGNR